MQLLMKNFKECSRKVSEKSRDLYMIQRGCESVGEGKTRRKFLSTRWKKIKIRMKDMIGESIKMLQIKGGQHE